jgi:hypothetical protein
MGIPCHELQLCREAAPQLIPCHTYLPVCCPFPFQDGCVPAMTVTSMEVSAESLRKKKHRVVLQKKSHLLVIKVCHVFLFPEVPV